jgi:predicted lactoylglutathione lyase
LQAGDQGCRAATERAAVEYLVRRENAMLTDFPQAVPEIPVSHVEKAAGYYVDVLGFSFDWGDDAGGIGGISQGHCRLFLTNAPFRGVDGMKGPVIVWLNLNNKQEVDELFERWKHAGARIVEAVEDKPWNLREFRVADLDGNQLRVFYDFNWELREERRR